MGFRPVVPPPKRRGTLYQHLVSIGGDVMTSKPIVNVAFICAVGLAFTSAASAELQVVSLVDLVAASDLIARGTVTSRAVTDRGGTATLQPRETYKGGAAGQELTLSWGNELHDQPISCTDCDYLVFLKSTRHGPRAALYDQGYWPIARASDGREVIRYAGGVTAVEIPLEILTMATLAGETTRRPTRVIALDAFLVRIRDLIPQPSSDRSDGPPSRPGAVEPPAGASRWCDGHVTGPRRAEGPFGPHIVWTAYTSEETPDVVVSRYLESLGSEAHSSENGCDTWGFPLDRPDAVLTVCPLSAAGPWRKCGAVPSAAATVVLISSMTRAE